MDRFCTCQIDSVLGCFKGNDEPHPEASHTLTAWTLLWAPTMVQRRSTFCSSNCCTANVTAAPGVALMMSYSRFEGVNLHVILADCQMLNVLHSPGFV